VQLCFLDELQAFTWGISYGLLSQTTIKSSTFQSIPKLGQAAPEDLVAYLMVTAEVGLPDAV